MLPKLRKYHYTQSVAHGKQVVKKTVDIATLCIGPTITKTRRVQTFAKAVVICNFPPELDLEIQKNPGSRD